LGRPRPRPSSISSGDISAISLKTHFVQAPIESFDMTIRPAALDDLDRLLALGREMHAESSYRSLNFDERKARMFLMRLMSDQYVRVYEQDDKILGGMVGMSVQPWFSNDLYAVDIALFISAKHRGSLAAARLIKDFVVWAKQTGAKQIRPGVTTGAPGTAASRLYQAMGFTNCGSTFYLNAR